MQQLRYFLLFASRPGSIKPYSGAYYKCTNGAARKIFHAAGYQAVVPVPEPSAGSVEGSGLTGSFPLISGMVRVNRSTRYVSITSMVTSAAWRGGRLILRILFVMMHSFRFPGAACRKFSGCSRFIRILELENRQKELGEELCQETQLHLEVILQIGADILCFPGFSADDLAMFHSAFPPG
jgi:hypothetical protein